MTDLRQERPTEPVRPLSEEGNAPPGAQQEVPEWVYDEATDKLEPGFVRRRLLGCLRPVATLLVFALIFLVVCKAATLSVPRIMALLIDHAIGQGEGAPISSVAGLLILLFVVAAGCQFMGVTLLAYVGERVALALRRDVFSHLLSLSSDFFDRRRIGELMSRIASDTTEVRAIGLQLASRTAMDVIVLVGGIVLAATTNAHLTLLMFALLPGVVLVTVGPGKLIRRLSTEVQDKLADSNAVVEETLAGIETVKSSAREDDELARYGVHLRAVLRTALRQALARAAQLASLTMFFHGGMVALLVYSMSLVQDGEMTMGELVAFMVYTVFIGNAMSGVTMLWAQWQQLLGAAQRVFQIMREEPSIVDRPNALAFDGSHQRIAFENVCFRYPSDPDRDVIHDLSFSVRRGEVVALVGESGAGKSTVVSLLLRHYEVTGGAIKIDDNDIRDLKQRDLRQSIATVLQNVVVFGRTLRENIAYRSPEASDEDVESAARAAHALEFIERLPNGFATIAGDRGTQLSGGERQRIAIARALLKDPQILVLDEATSSLDTESEQLVRQALDRLVTDRTTIVIAHRLSTVERADRVLVLHRGRLVESGKHADLLAKGGRYARLYRSGALETAPPPS